jgi:TonB family protein
MRGFSTPLRADRSPAVRTQADLDIPQPSWTIVLVATASVAGLTWALMHQRSPEADVRHVVAVNLAAAQLAMEDGRYLDPPQNSALARYTAVLALDPQNMAARVGIEQIANEYVGRAQHAIANNRFAEAVVAMDKLRRVRPRHQQLRELEGLLAQQLERRVAELRPEAEPPPERTARTGGARTPSVSNEERAARSANARAAAPDALPDATLRDDFPASGFDADARPALIAAVNRTAPAATAGDYIRLAASYESVREHLRGAALSSPTAAGEVLRASTAEAEVAQSGAGVAIDSPAAMRDPQLVHSVQPTYPQSALRRGLEGWVDLTLVIGPSGDVIDTIVHERSGSVSFERAAVLAVQQWKYEPRAPGDNAVRDRVPVRIRFRLDEASSR